MIDTCSTDRIRDWTMKKVWYSHANGIVLDSMPFKDQVGLNLIQSVLLKQDRFLQSFLSLLSAILS